jgi:Xaa-Pro aminopeptidase
MADHVLEIQGAPRWEHKILPLRRQAEVQNGWLHQRLETVLPEIMRREGFDMWIVAGREYNEDPVLLTLLPATAISARRRTILVFRLGADGQLEMLALSRSGSGHDEIYQAVWDQAKEGQWECLGRLVRERDPRSIGVNVSRDFAFGDGLTHSEFEELSSALGPELMAKARGAERLAVGWLERRTRQELDAYPGIVEIVHGIVAEAFSPAVVHPGVTSCADVSWWMRQRMHDLGLRPWFHPSVSAQRQADPKPDVNRPILPGDLLHCDIGFHYLGLATDCQQLAYVLKPDEAGAPEGVEAALRAGNRLQDILAAECKEGRTGNQILAASLERMEAEGLNGSIYTHPLGYHGHGAGPTIGLFDNQEGVPSRGDYELFNDTCHAMELNVRFPVPEWGGQEVRAALEEDVAFTGGRVLFLDGRQTSLHVIR